MPDKGLPPIQSRRLLSIEKKIASDPTSTESVYLRAKKAALLAHSSDFEAARSLIKRLRAANQGYEPRLSAWIMYCEGILHHAERFDARASIERLIRANIFAGAVGDVELTSSCSAWLAYSYFSVGELDRVSAHLCAAFELAEEDAPPLSRAYLVLADALAWAGAESLARPWYNRARLCAADCGDIVMQNSVIYNSAAMRVANLNLMLCRGERDQLAEQLAQAEVDSAATLNALTGNQSNREMIPLLQAELFTAMGLWERALGVFDEYFSRAQSTAFESYSAKLRVQHALCLGRMGRYDEAAVELENGLSQLDQCCDLDDLAVIHSRAAETCELIGLHDRIGPHRHQSQFALTQFEAQRNSILTTLEPAIAAASARKVRTNKNGPESASSP